VDESCLLSNTENTKSSHQNLNRFPKDETEKNKLQIENTLRLHSNQIFLGMISMQYRAKIVNLFLIVSHKLFIASCYIVCCLEFIGCYKAG